MTDASEVLLAGLLAAAASAGATPLAAALARRLGIMDRPGGGYKRHARPTPLLGGVAVVAGLLAGLVGADDFVRPRPLLALGAGGAVVLLAGLVDDRRALSAKAKLAWQLLAAAAAAALLLRLDVKLRLFIPNAALGAGLTVAWVVAVTNAMNLADHANGLCAGSAALAAATLAAANLRTGDHDVALASACLAGACLGYLPWNWPRARIFLGDGGSLTIGFLLAGLAVLGVYTPGAERPVLAVGTPLVAMAVPLLDVAVVVWLRRRAGHPAWVGDRRHLAHRLMRSGYAPAGAVALCWAAGAAAGATALLLPGLAPAGATLALALLAALLAALFAAAGTDGLP